MAIEAVDESLLEELFGAIGRFLDGLFNRIAVSIESAFSVVAESIGEMFERVIGTLETIVNNIAEIVGDIFGKIEDFIQITINEILTFIDEILTDLIAGINSLITDTTQYIKNLTSDVVLFFEGLVDDAAGMLSDIFDKVYQSITGIVDQVTNLFSDIFDTVVTNIEAFVDQVKLFLGDLFDVVKEGIETIFGQAQEVVGALKQAITDFITQVINVVGGTLRELLDTISDLPGEIADLTNRMIESAKENIGDPIKGLPLELIETISSFITGNTLDDLDRMELQALNNVFGTSPVPRSPELFREGIERSMPSNPILKGIVTAILTPLILIQLMGGIASANSQIILQEHALENPYRLIEPPDLVRGKHFDLLSENDTVTDLRKHGYTDSDARIMLQIGETLAPEAEQVVWWLRGFSTDADLEHALHAHGWSSESIEKLKLSVFFIPPVQDLITMAVREVFTPEIAERFGQYEDLPPQFVSNALKQGVSEEWATNYWAAHWTLPSVQMGFQMLHRRVITEDDLNLLLRSADVMPFWRDKLVAISFSPLTRVDIRRMHKLGVLTDDQVLLAYQDIGYNPENAQLLLDFTIQLNKPSQAQDDQDLSTLTRTNIINFYSDGVLSRVKATSLLTDIGMSLDAADLFLDGTDMELQRQERKAEIEIILDRADSGVLTFEQAQDALNRLGLQTLEIEIALADLAKREAKRTKLPSRADLDKMLGAEIIDSTIYIDTIRRLGYSNEWAQRYLKLAQG